MSDGFQIGGRVIGANQKVYIIAEMSGNHGQHYQQAEEIIREAAKAGADAVKLQTYTPDTITIDCEADCFRIGNGTIWEGRRLYDLYSEAYTPWEWQPRLKKLANELGMDLFSSPFDSSAVKFLEDIEVPAYKIASFELIDIPLIRCICATGKPVIMSVGMASLAEIEEAVSTARSAGVKGLALLKCTSAYPARPEEMNLRTIPDLAMRFGVPVGVSDHTSGIAIPAAAVAVGACIVEKHLTLSRAAGGPDAAFSLEPHEFREMVEVVRTVEKAMGKINFAIGEHEKASRLFRRSLFAVKNIEAGEEFTEYNIRSIRPGGGLHPRHMTDLIGKKAAARIARGTALSWDLVSK